MEKAFENPALALRSTLMTDKELGIAFGCSPFTVCRWRLQDGLPYTRVGKKPLIDVEDAKRWLASRKVGANSSAA